MSEANGNGGTQSPQGFEGAERPSKGVGDPNTGLVAEDEWLNSFFRSGPNNYSGLDLAFDLHTTSGGSVGPWWSKGRDRCLRELARGNDFTLSAINIAIKKLSSVPLRVEARNENILSHARLAQRMNQVVQRALPRVAPKLLFDLLTQDNGAFAVTLGAFDVSKPLASRQVTGLAHLDSEHVDRTGDDIYPVRYKHREFVQTNNRGQRVATRPAGRQVRQGTWEERYYRIHHTRLINIVEMPSPDRDMHGVGLCFMSRVLQMIEVMTDHVNLIRETMGGRPATELIHGKNFKNPSELQRAFMLADKVAGNQGNLIHGGRIFTVGPDGGEVQRIPLHIIPEGFEWEMALKNGMYMLATAMGLDPKEFYPGQAAASTRGAASINHVTTQDKLPTWWATTMASLIERHVLNSEILMVTSDLKDDEKDRNKAAIRTQRSQRRQLDLANGLTTHRVERQQMLSDGEITEQQFVHMELAAERTPDEGLPIRVLFSSEDTFFQEALDLSVENPADLEAHDPEELLPRIADQLLKAERRAFKATLPTQYKHSYMVIAALTWLQKKYIEKQEQIKQEEEIQRARQLEEISILQGNGKKPEETSGQIRSRNLPVDSDNDSVVYEEEIQGGVPIDFARAAALRGLSPDEVVAEFTQSNEVQQDQVKEESDDWVPPFLSKNAESSFFSLMVATRQDIADIFRQLSGGSLDRAAVEERFREIIDRVTTFMFLVGSARLPDEIPEEAEQFLEDVRELHHDALRKLSDDLDEGGALVGKPVAIENRIEMWTLGLASETFSVGQLFDTQNEFYRWVADPVTESCEDCLRLDEQVHSREEWIASGWHPNANFLACGGFLCRCRFQPHEGPSKGNF